MRGIDHKNSNSVTEIIRKESGKVWMGNTEGLLQLLWKRRFMETSNDIFTY